MTAPGRVVQARWVAVGVAACLLVAARPPVLSSSAGPSAAVQTGMPAAWDPTTVLWYDHPAARWEDALPVGNGRLGAMVFGRADDEEIHLNEETYWSGGPYTTTVEGARKGLADVRRLIFEGQLVQAHRAFGRTLLGYPVEQQKYQALGLLALRFPDRGPVEDYTHRLDLDTAIVTTRYRQGGVRLTREVFVSPVDQVIVIQITADQPGRITMTAQLRGARNTAHSNYATDYFTMDGAGSDGLVLRGKSADYMGIRGALRYEARLKAVARGGETRVDDDTLHVQDADSVTLLIAAATNFVSYRDVSGRPDVRVHAALAGVAARNVESVRAAHVAEHQRLFRRTSLTLDAGADSALPTDERQKRFDGASDPAFAGLLFQFGRYLLISSSRPGTQPANLQGLWNASMNPPWDSKYTTNINTQMNYWPAEVANLSECAQPLFTMIRELTDRGSDVAREHYGARGWVMHQNTDLWRVAAPMDGPSWGAFTTGGAWLATHLWEHYLYTGDREHLREYYPVLRGSAEFFLDFLVPHPRFGWLVTNPSTSPENFPLAPGNEPFFDEVTTFISPGTALVAGSTIDNQILNDLFGYVAEASVVLGVDQDFRERLIAARGRLAPMRIGRRGDLQEWLDDWDQREKSHRHISHLYGLFPGHQISATRTPAFAEGSRRVLEQRGLEGNGWSSAWKTAAWARLGRAPEAMANVSYAVKHYTTASLFSICSRQLQVDGAFGMTAAIAEMLLQSHEDAIVLLPALPAAWSSGEVRGLRARGGFEVGIRWREGRPVEASLRSTVGGTCRVRGAGGLRPTELGREVPVARPAPDILEFETAAGRTYLLTRPR